MNNSKNMALLVSLGLAVLTLPSCQLHEVLPDYEGGLAGDPCGPCARFELRLDGSCDLGEFETVLEPTDSCDAMVFVDASSASDTLNGSPEDPFASLRNALDQAQERQAKVVLVAGDTDTEYDGPLVVRNAIHVWGGWEPGTFARRLEFRPRVVTTGSSEDTQIEGMTAQSITSPTMVSRLEVRTLGDAHTHVGALLQDVAALELERMVWRPGDGRDGRRGTAGRPGADGGFGESGGDSRSRRAAGDGGENTTCPGELTQGGEGGIGALNSNDGTQDPRRGQDAFNAQGGREGLPGTDGGSGENGDPGTNGMLGTQSDWVGLKWTWYEGDAGANGQDGEGGAGGGGAEAVTGLDESGGGGGGGAGGCGGTPGGPGEAGGASIGLVLLGTPPVFRSSEVITGRGGDGGAPGPGGPGGSRGRGAPGASTGGAQDMADGGSGGDGGHGGDGGDGAPGWPGSSIGVWCIGQTSELDALDIQTGASGAWSLEDDDLVDIESMSTRGCS